MLFAHRGCSYRCPENTLPAFIRAAEKNIQGIELDIQLTADGEIAVFHDEDLSRICGVNRKVSTLNSFELSTMDAGAWKGGAFRGTEIPLLKNVLMELSPTVLFDVEIKYYDSATVPRLLKKLNEIVTELRVPPERICLSSFDPRIIRQVKKRIPRIPAGLIYDRKSLPLGIASRSAGLIVTAAVCQADFLKPQAELTGQTRHLPRLCWTVDDEQTAQKCLQNGAEGIISNRPEDLSSAIQAISERHQR